MKKELFKEICVDNGNDTEYEMKLSYYLLTDSVSEEYCDLKMYGVEIDKLDKNGRGGEKKIISDLFFRKNEALEFLKDIAIEKITPRGLKYAVKDYIGERIQVNEQNIV